MNRNAFDLSLGGPLKITIPEYGITELIVRVQNVDLGEIDNNKITVEFVQDVFASKAVLFADPADTGWVNTRPVPEDILDYTIVEMPRFYGRQLEQPVEDGFGAVIPFAVSPKLASHSFDLLCGIETFQLDIREPAETLYPFSAFMDADYSRDAGFVTGTDATGFTINGLIGQFGATPEAVLPADIQTGEFGILYLNGEWLAYEGVTDNLDGTFTLDNIHRGLLGSRPRDHLLGDIIYFFNVDLLSVSTIGGELLENGFIYYKLLDRVGGAVRGFEDQLEQSRVLLDIADRPLRPRNFQLNATRSTEFRLNTDATPTLSWVASNREEDAIPFEQDAAETPDQTETYDIEVWKNGSEIGALAATGVTSPHDLNLSTFPLGTGEIRIYSRRTVGDLKTSVDYAFHQISITGAAATGALTIGSAALQGTVILTIEGSGGLTTGPAALTSPGIAALTVGGVTLSGSGSVSDTGALTIGSTALEGTGSRTGPGPMDGGSASSRPADIVDSGTAASRPADIIEGGTAV